MGFLESLWNVVWVALVIFAFVSYLTILIAVVVDLVRDRELSGWWKAVWMLFLLFVPFLTALVYLIARGRGMAERRYKEAEETRTATDAYIRHVARNPAGEIATARQLLADGAITEAEYEQLKRQALTGSSA